jgi:hypothetical protein
MKLAEVLPRDNYLLYVVTDDGRTGLFDFAPYLESEAFAPLRNSTEFERVHNGGYFVEWDCGADLSADTIEARWKLQLDVTADKGTEFGGSEARAG